jgi:hypothetical protein
MKNMRSTTLAFSIIILVLAFCFCSACLFDNSSSPETTTAPTQTVPPAVNGGITRINGPAAPPSISYPEAEARLRDDMKSYGDAVGKIRIYYIQGKGVDEKGNANSWMFGISPSSGNMMLVFDGIVWDTVPYGGDFPSEEIISSGIILPAALLQQNKEVIAKATPPGSQATQDLVLSQGVYILKISSGSTIHILKFDATTGALLT